MLNSDVEGKKMKKEYTYKDFCSLYDKGRYQECILAGIALLAKKRRKEAGILAEQMSRAYFSWEVMKGDIGRYNHLFSSVRRCLSSSDDC